MAFSHSTLVAGPLTAAVGKKDLPVKRAVMVATMKAPSTPLQVVKEEIQKLQDPKSLTLSRRDTMLYLTAEALTGFALLSVEPAEARGGKLEMRRKILEKLEKLREKAGVSKSKNKNETQTSPAQPSAKKEYLPSLADGVLP